MRRTIWFGLLAVFVTVTAGGSIGQAQQVTGTPGSPSATTTIDGKQLPPPDPKFGGVRPHAHNTKSTPVSGYALVG
jgi:hypothetical protein